jgi:hypothetical protein
MERFTMVVGDEEQSAAFAKAKQVLRDRLFSEGGDDAGMALRCALAAWCQEMSIKIVEPREHLLDGALVMSLSEKEYNEWLMLSEKSWREHISETGIDFACAIDSGLEAGLKSIGLEVYPEEDSPARDWVREEPAAPTAAKPQSGRFSSRSRAEEEARIEGKYAAKARNATSKPKRAAKALAAPATGLNGKGHINGLANGAAAH